MSHQNPFASGSGISPRAEASSVQPMTEPASNMESTARALVAQGKGILAADESFPTIEKRFKSIGLPSSEEIRRVYRELLFTTPGIGEFLSGAILFDETIRQRTRDGVPLPDVLKKRGVIPGIKVDKGALRIWWTAGTAGLIGGSSLWTATLSRWRWSRQAP